MNFKDWIANLHYKPGKCPSPWLWPLLPCAWLYGLGISLRYFAYGLGWKQSAISAVPIISVGNLTTGGTGKTPMVQVIARGLIQAGKTVVILSRGYGAEEPVDYARALDPKHGDEAYLLQALVPESIVVVGKDRVHTLERAVRDYRPDYVLLDDGFQYLPLQRSLNILLIDGIRLLGNGCLLPMGPLREPLSALRRADLVLVTKGVDTSVMQRVEGWVNQYGGKPKPTILPVPFEAKFLKSMKTQQLIRVDEAMKQRPVIAFSGIAQPAQFEADLQSLGLTLAEVKRFSDHHVYQMNDWNALQQKATTYEQPILVTTDKDLPKLRAFIPEEWQKGVYTLQVQPALDGRWFYEEFITQIQRPVQAEVTHVH